MPAKPAGNPGPAVDAEIHTGCLHPEGITNVPGQFPKCGMDLVKK